MPTAPWGPFTDLPFHPWDLGLSPRSASSLRQHVEDGTRSSAQWFVTHAIFVSALLVSMVMCLGIFEYIHFSTFILESTCSVQDLEIVELGACSSCNGMSCSLYPKAMARMVVTFQPLHWERNVTGVVSHCKYQQINGCLRSNTRSLPQVVGGFRWQDIADPSSVVRWSFEGGDGDDDCDLSSVYRYTKAIRAQPVRKCYYNSREPGGDQVWFSVGSPMQRGTLQVMNHQGIPLLCVLFGVMLFLATLLGCLSLVD